MILIWPSGVVYCNFGQAVSKITESHLGEGEKDFFVSLSLKVPFPLQTTVTQLSSNNNVMKNICK